MATIEKRSNGNWRVRIRRVGFPNINQTFTTRSDAEAWAKKKEAILKDYKKGKLTNPDSNLLTLKSLLERYSEKVSPTKRSHVQEKSRIRVISRHSVVNMPVSSLNKQLFELYRDERLQEVSGKTVREELILIQHCIQLAITKWGVDLVGNPVFLVKKP